MAKKVSKPYWAATFGDPLYGVQYYGVRAYWAALPHVIHRLIDAQAVTHLRHEGAFDEAVAGRCMSFMRQAGKLQARCILVYINAEEALREQRLTTVHEALHATFQVMDHVGMEWHGASEEAFTYYHTWVTGRLWEGLKL